MNMEQILESLQSNPAFIYIGIAVIAALVIYGIVRYVRYKGLEGIRNDVYKLFCVAENEFVYGANSEKFNYVINQAYALLPPVMRLFISEELLRKFVQALFDSVKDLLDNGKLDKSNKETENQEVV